MNPAFPTFRRAFITASIADMTGPTAIEIGGGTDISDCLTPDGLNVTPSDETIDNTLWVSQIITQRVVRFGWDGASLTATREFDPGLWELAVFGAEMFLTVLVGSSSDRTWRGSTEVEVYRFTFGLRAVNAHEADQPITFTVPIYVSAYEYATLVGSFLSIDDEMGDPILDEAGELLLAES